MEHPWFSNPQFQEAWKNWEKSRKEKAGEFQLKRLLKLAGEDMETAILIMDESTGAGWKGLCPLKGNNGTNYKSKSERLNDAARELKRRLTETARPDRSAVFEDVTFGNAGAAGSGTTGIIG